MGLLHLGISQTARSTNDKTTLLVESSSILFNHRSFPTKTDLVPPFFFEGFLTRFGSLERMDTEGTPGLLFTSPFLDGSIFHLGPWFSQRSPQSLVWCNQPCRLGFLVVLVGFVVAAKFQHTSSTLSKGIRWMLFFPFRAPEWP